MKLQARAATDSFRLNSNPNPLLYLPAFTLHNNTTSPSKSMHHSFIFDQCISAIPAVLHQDMVDKKERNT
jgi:hypothetical protein